MIRCTRIYSLPCFCVDNEPGMDRSSARITKMKNGQSVLCQPEIRRERRCKAVASETDVVNTGIVNDSCKYDNTKGGDVQVINQLRRLFAFGEKFSRISFSLHRFHSYMRRGNSTRMLASVRIAISDKWHFRYFCAIQSSDACQRVW